MTRIDLLAAQTAADHGLDLDTVARLIEGEVNRLAADRARDAREQPYLDAIAHAAVAREQARAAWELAIRDAADAGVAQYRIAPYAHVSRQRVNQIVNA